MGALSDRVEQLVDEINRDNMESIRENIAPDYFDSSPSVDDPDARETIHRLVSDLAAAVPDLHISLSRLQDEGERVGGHLALRGTHRNTLWGAPGTGRSIAWEVDVSVRLRDGGFAINFGDLTTPQALDALRQFGLINPADRMDKPVPHPVSLPDHLYRVLFTGQAGDKACSHLDTIKVTEPAESVCRQCVASGDVWPALRMCLECGFVGCCDRARNAHMQKHQEESGHPLFRSIHIGEGWVWCRPDSAFFSSRTLERISQRKV